MPTSFAERRKEAERAGLLGSGDYLKLKEGQNRLRLMTECLPHPGQYKGKRTFKWICYIVDRVDGKVKVFFMPHTIYKQIEALQISEDYAFADVPMPYDLTVNADGAGTKEVKYTLLPARKESPITALEYQQLAALKPLAELQKALQEKNEKENTGGAQPPVHDDEGEDDERGTRSLDADDIPFMWLLPLVMPLLGASMLWMA